MKCPRCQQDNPPRAKFCLECGAPVNGSIPTASYAELRGDNDRLRLSLAEAIDEATEASEQQRATSEILRVISDSPTDVQPVFDAIVQSAMRLLSGYSALVLRIMSDEVHVAALTSVTPASDESVRANFPRPIAAAGVSSHVIQTRQPYIVSDTETDEVLSDDRRRTARLRGYRSILAMPMIRDGRVIGVLNVTRQHAGTFSDDETNLLRTFADQAVIAIENVRLFTELQASNHDLTNALDKQTATSEILRVISQSQTDVQPVFDTIIRNAVQLSGAIDGSVYRLDGEMVHGIAHHNFTLEQAEDWRRLFPRALSSLPGPVGRVLGTGSTYRIADLEAEPDSRIRPEMLANMRSRGVRSLLVVPMVRHREVIGCFGLTHRETGAFTDAHVELLKTFADQAVIAIANVRLFTELQEKNRALTEAHAQVTESLERQTATSQILRVISQSPTDAQPVFDAMAASAARLCESFDSIIWRQSGDHLVAVAHHGPIPMDPGGLPLTRESVPGRALLDGRTFHLTDLQAEADEFPIGGGLARRHGFRTVLNVPLMRDGVAIGVITLRRTEVKLFTDRQVELLKTFADQAVIAIENVRLFNETKEALERQTATSEILQVISSSPTDVQPVFEAICRSAVRLFDAYGGLIIRFDGQLMHVGAVVGSNTEAIERYRRLFPRPPDREMLIGRVILDRTVLHVADVEQAEPRGVRETGRDFGFRRALIVPMLREGEAIGTLNVVGPEPGFYSDRQVELLKTFADQAVIAIENARLFTELQTSNRELTAALDTQTATSDILRVISQSQTDVQPVFDAIVHSAVRLLGGSTGSLTRVVGDRIELAALTSTDRADDDAIRASFPRPLRSRGTHAQAIRDRAPLNVADALTDPRVSDPGRAARAGYRSRVSVPLLRHREAIGALVVTRREPGGFTDEEIALLQTFADQAVIAIENVRLFTELQASNRDLATALDKQTATADILGVISRSQTDVQPVFDAIVQSAVRLLHGYTSTLARIAGDQIELAALTSAEPAADAALMARYPQPLDSKEGYGLAIRGRAPLNIADALTDLRLPETQRTSARLRDFRSLVVVPLLRHDEAIGALGVSRREPGGFTDDEIALLQTFADQAVIAIENVRLFHEIEDKSQQLEAASRHKSEFLANMSHELRTPLNAVIGFSEVLSEGMFGQLNEKQEEYARDIYSSGQHLLSLINDILDLSKIEAGRMELEVTEFHLPAALDNALTLVRERAGRRGIALGMTVDERLGQVRADERKIRQVVLNLLSNAIKFTPEGGRIEVRAAPVDGSVEVSVTDTGMGIAPEDQEAIFEEFKQVGTAAKKVEGTGLGLALSRKFIELHGGRIWVKSEPGVGSTFTFSIPTHTGA